MKIEDTYGLGILYFKLTESSLSEVEVMDEVFDKVFLECALSEIQGVSI